MVYKNKLICPTFSGEMKGSKYDMVTLSSGG